VGKKWYHYFVVTDSGPAASAEPGTVPAAPSQRVVDLVPDAEGDTAFTGPVATPSDLAEIYTSAQIAIPAHGYTVLKIAEMLQSEHIRELPAEVKQKSVRVALDAAGVTVNEIVEDAVQRDRALDTYERVLERHLEKLRAEKSAENTRLEEEINQRVAELRGRIDANNAEVNREQENLRSWKVRKRQEEDRIAEAIGHFVSPNPITTADSSGKDKGGTNVR
jgi:hypothetical protein